LIAQPTAQDVFLECCPEAELYEKGVDFDGVIVQNDYALAAYGYEGDDLSSSLASGACSLAAAVVGCALAIAVL